MINKKVQPRQGFRNWFEKEGSAYTFISGYALMFIIFIVVPVLVAIILSFTLFDTIQFPKWIGLKNYITLITQEIISRKPATPTKI